MEPICFVLETDSPEAGIPFGEAVGRFQILVDPHVVDVPPLFSCTAVFRVACQLVDTKKTLEIRVFAESLAEIRHRLDDAVLSVFELDFFEFLGFRLFFCRDFIAEHFHHFRDGSSSLFLSRNVIWVEQPDEVVPAIP